MTSIREQLAVKIAAEFIAIQVDVHPFGYQPEELRRPAVAVFRAEVEQGANILDHAFTVQIMTPYGAPTVEAEDALDTLLDHVLTGLKKVDVVSWKTAKRTVFLEMFQGWEIDVTWTSNDYY